MKKIFAILTVLIMVTSLLAGCAKKDDMADKDTTKDTATETKKRR